MLVYFNEREIHIFELYRQKIDALTENLVLEAKIKELNEGKINKIEFHKYWIDFWEKANPIMRQQQRFLTRVCEKQGFDMSLERKMYFKKPH